MQFPIPNTVTKRIEQELQRLKDKVTLLDSSLLSQQIQHSLPKENVALEDIQSAVEAQAIKAGFSLLLDRPLSIAGTSVQLR